MGLECSVGSISGGMDELAALRSQAVAVAVAVAVAIKAVSGS